MIRYLLSRIGILMLLGGILLFVIGAAGVRAGEPAFTYLFLGITLTTFGFILWKKLRTKNKKSNRFSMFRRRKDEDLQEGEEENSRWK